MEHQADFAWLRGPECDPTSGAGLADARRCGATGVGLRAAATPGPVARRPDRGQPADRATATPPASSPTYACRTETPRPRSCCRRWVVAARYGVEQMELFAERLTARATPPGTSSTAGWGAVAVCRGPHSTSRRPSTGSPRRPRRPAPRRACRALGRRTPCAWAASRTAATPGGAPRVRARRHLAGRGARPDPRRPAPASAGSSRLRRRPPRPGPTLRRRRPRPARPGAVAGVGGPRRRTTGRPAQQSTSYVDGRGRGGPAERSWSRGTTSPSIDPGAAPSRRSEAGRRRRRLIELGVRPH